MVSSLAGVSIFSLEDTFLTSATFVSLEDGSELHTASHSAPSVPSSTESGLRSTFDLIAESERCKPALISLAYGTPTEERSAIVSALASSKLPFQSDSITHGQAYCASVPIASGCPLILFLNYAPTQISSELLLCTIDEGLRGTRVDRQKVLPVAETQQEEALQKWVHLGPAWRPPLDRIILLNQFPDALSKTLQSALSIVHPNIPVHSATPEEISKGAALCEYTYYDRPIRTAQTAQYVIPLPISIATTSGGVITFIPAGRKLPARDSVVLTTSLDNQTSVTVKLLLGNHPSAEDNLQRDVLVLEGLRPMPKGTARIRVSGRVVHSEGTSVNVTVEQIGDETDSGELPKKVFAVPHLFENLGENYSRYRIASDEEFVSDSAEIVAELPE